MQPTVQQAGLLPEHAERGGAKDHQRTAQTGQVDVQRHLRERTAGPRDPAHIPEAADRKEQEPAQHRLLVRPVVSEHLDQVRHRRVLVNW